MNNTRRCPSIYITFCIRGMPMYSSISCILVSNNGMLLSICQFGNHQNLIAVSTPLSVPLSTPPSQFFFLAPSATDSRLAKLGRPKVDSGDPAKGGDKDNLIFCPTKPAFPVCVLPLQRFKSFPADQKSINQNKEKRQRRLFSFSSSLCKTNFSLHSVCAASERINNKPLFFVQ